MLSLPTTAAIAGAGAATAYLNAKFHLKKDMTALWNMKAAERTYMKAAKENRQSLWYLLEEQVNRMPEHEECIWAREATYTWQQMYEQACRYAQLYLSLGVGPKDLVGFYLQNSADFVLAWAGTWAVGAAPAMINYNLGGDGLIHCLKVSQSKIVLVDEDSDVRQRIEDSRDRIENELGIKILVLDADLKAKINSLPATRPDDKLRATVAAMDPMCLFYTSGTTGLPKACPYHVARTWQGAGPRVRSLGIEPGPNGDRWYDCMPMYHGTGGNVAAICLLSGVTLCIGKKFSTSRFWEDIRDSRATAFVYVGETARYLMAAPASPRDREHHVKMMFGNGLRPDIWKRFKDRFGIEIVSEFFNSTEGVFTLLNVDRGDFLSACVGHHGGLLRALLRNVYIPVAIDDADGSIKRDPATGFAIRKSYNEGGEMIVQVPDTAAFAGYWNSPDATAKKFAKDVFQKGDLYFRSGDALRRDDDGRWHFLDRLGDTFRWKSENVSTAEVAVALGKFPGVAEANVYGVELPHHEGRAGAAALYIQPEQRAGFDWRGLRAHAAAELPRYAVPVFLRLVKDQAPMHNNKQNKVPLRKEGADPDKVRNGDGGREDVLMWCPPKSDRYVEFRQQDWEQIASGKAKL